MTEPLSYPDGQREWLLKFLDDEVAAYAHFKGKGLTVESNVKYGCIDAIVRIGWHFDLFDVHVVNDLIRAKLGGDEDDLHRLLRDVDEEE